MTGLAAARVGDPFGHSSALSGVLTGLAVGALVGVAIVATGGLGAIAVGAAIATTGAAGLAGQAIGQTLDGPETGRIATGSPDVLVNGRPAALTVVSVGPCSRDSGPPMHLATGAGSVLINGRHAGRVSEKMDCSAAIRSGSPDVWIGGPSAGDLPLTPEVPVWADATLSAMAIGGALIATAGVAAAYGVGAAAGGLVGGIGGGWAGGKAGGAAAAALGYGATGQAIGSTVGGFLGGAVGGGAGFRGGAATEAGLATAGRGTALASEGAATAQGGGALPRDPAPASLYRVDGRDPATIFSEGCQPKGTSTDLKTYVDTNRPSAFVSTSKSASIARNPEFAKPGTHMYEIDGAQVSGVDVNKAYPDNPFAHEDEFAVLGGVPHQAVISAKPVMPDGTLGPAVFNPRYKPGPP